ncbi:hypothetical protein [Larkinella soli]|uniref:hypothetical protein n=1 Tax=Larkinella soli TaxID=1770527 RepID=UPI000FFB8EB7|nr:hypothetical protein [Larkinella soli]
MTSHYYPSPEKQLADRLWQQKRERFPSLPDYGIPRPIIKTNTTNGLTRAILQTFEAFGFYVTRVQSQGQYDPRTKRFRAGQTKRGTADLHGVINGQHVSIEIKFGKDRMSDAQRKTQQQIEQSGGIYYVARDFASFWTWFHSLLPSHP